ncbi:MAG: PBP1A family penicillin-binding protein [Hyphomicrobiaceae bacterium]|nr:PBP1A family penicillin-binding protein [Hyphomicrobiaceae bacterium]
MSDWFFKQGGRDRIIDWLSIDSKFDSMLSETWTWIANTWNAGTSFFARFRLTGWRRLANELACETLTLGAGGLVLVYALALPAFKEFDESKYLTGQFAVKFLDRNGAEIGKRGVLQNDAVPLEEIPDSVIKATLATEDRRFFEHYGIDVLGTFRALSENVRANSVVQGGSTLTQQLAKNLFLSPERSVQRKIKELFLAFLLESRHSKREILKMYLDRAYMGGGAFGVEAGAQFYFNKSIRDVTLAEAALLAGLFKAPTSFAPHVDLAASRARTNEVLTNLVEAGFYTSGQVQFARLNPAQYVETVQTNTPDWFLDYAFEEVQRIARQKNEFILTARTTVDLTLQKAADEALVSTLRSQGRGMRATSGALVSMETDGAVRAIVGGLDYGDSQFNRATSARRQPGSSFKPYVYALALENGYRPTSLVRDSSRRCGSWVPKNYNGSYGSGRRLTLTTALADSLNTTAADLSLSIGREKLMEVIDRLGITGVRRTCSMALGDGGLTVLEHTGGVATFANGGKLVRPYTVLELVNSKGELVYSRQRDEKPAAQAFARRVAEDLNVMMHAVVMEGTGKRAQLEFTNVAGKTGTSSSYRDAWFVGYTGKYVTGVWIGNDDFRPMGRVTGGSLPASIWHAYMSVAHTDMNIPTIPGLRPHPVQVEEQARIASARQADPNSVPADQRSANTASLMSEKMRTSLRQLSAALRKAGGLAEPAAVGPGNAPAAGPAGAQPGSVPGSGGPAQTPPDRDATPPAQRGEPQRRRDAALGTEPSVRLPSEPQRTETR